MPHRKRSSSFPSTLRGKPAQVWVEKTVEGIRLNAKTDECDPSRTTLDALDDVVLLADDAGRYIDANEAFCAVTGYTLNEVLGLSVKQITAPDSSVDAGAIWLKFLGKGAMAGRYPLKLKDGSVRVFAYQAFTNALPGAHISLLRPL